MTIDFCYSVDRQIYFIYFIEERNKKFLITGIGINIKKNPIIRNYPATNLQEVTKRKISKLSVENKLKQLFEKNLSKLYKNK